MKLTHRLVAAVALAAAVSVPSAGAALSATDHPRGPSAAGWQRTRPAGGFRPSSASFLSPSLGYLVGGVNCLPGRPCRAWLASTADGGARWKLARVPGVELGQASQVLFASPRIGWIYGIEQLWATSDGGRRWHLDRPGMGVLAMVVAGSRVLAMLTPDRGSRQPAGLYSSPVSHSSWSLVPRVTGPFAVLASYRDTAWFATAATATGKTSIWTSTAGGRWHRRPFACPGRDYALSSIAAASRSYIAYLCTDTADFGMTDEGMRVLVSTNGGRTAHLVGHWVPIISGSGGVLAMAPGNTRMITFATPSNAIGILGRSVDGGRAWHRIRPFSIGTWNCLSYLSRTTGYLVADVPPDGPIDSGLLRTTDAGRTWQRVRLPAVG